MNLHYTNLTKTAAYAELSETSPVNLAKALTPERIAACSIPAGGGMSYNYAAMPVSETIINTLQSLADEQQLVQKYHEVCNGSIMNTGEARAVLHHLTRGTLGNEVFADNENKRDFYIEQLETIKNFSEKVHNGLIKGSTGKQFTTVVQIGIGGSDLGPRALYLALAGNSRYMTAEFISNVDPDDAAAVCKRINFEETLFILVSKSGTTQETLTNQRLVLHKMTEAGIPGLKPAMHMVAVTSKTSPLAGSDDFLTSFFIDDYIGGRYSSTSAVGGLVLSLAYNFTTFQQVLEGAHEADRLALNPDIRRNPSLMDALIGIYLRNILYLPATAILPYSQALSRFAAHLQQLDMESNGKQVNRFGESLDYQTGPVIFGEPGTNGQHSFFQLLHQGTDIIPLQFVGFSESRFGEDITVEDSTSQEKLNANLAAQIVAFARGKSDKNPNKQFPGARPSSLLYGKKLTPVALGALLAHFENKVMLQGFCWNVNSFDQEGVQLGKILAKQVLSGTGDAVLEAYFSLLK